MCQRWQVNTNFSRLIKRWDDEAVLYDGGSGDTHLISIFHAEIITTLESGPLTADALRVQLKQPEVFGADVLDELLLDLVKLGVVEPVSE